jgi:soluble lytic murein transglycosylase
VPRAARTDVPEPQRARVRQLLLIDRLDEAGDELRALPPTTVGQGTLAWIEWRRGRLRNAIIAMKKAYPEYIGEAGDLLPADVWKILYPIGYADTLAVKATEENLDPALVAALVCQESTFDAGAVRKAGARGLMQIMGPTGRTLARDLGVRYRRAALHDPVTSLDFGTRYLRQMLDRFSGRVERALAAYNAGPHRVDAWTAGRPDFPDEEFVESIPFTETRYYVMTILASREHYQRLYGLPSATAVAAAAGGGALRP